MKKFTKKRKIGTHSETLWHFTGGPAWNLKLKEQTKQPKTMEKAFYALMNILKSRELKLGNYHEIIKCTVPEIREYDWKIKEHKIFRNEGRIIPTSPVCCVADIPIESLFHHARKYGKFAIGFKRSSLIKAGFNPVFYTLHNTSIILNFYNAHQTLEQSDTGIEGMIDELSNVLSDVQCNHTFQGNSEYEPDEDERSHEIDNIDTDSISSASNEMMANIDTALKHLKDTLAFIKTFDNSQFESIYSEREWRCTSSFPFKWNDVDSLIIPENKGYYRKFIQSDPHNNLGLPKRIKIYRWEEIEQ